MTRIVTVTLNPALDVSAETQAVTPGPKLRCVNPRYDPGGGGVNISRAIHLLGGESIAAIAAGGPNGDRVLALLAEEGVPVVKLPSPGPSRLSLAITEQGTGEQFRFVLPGPTWDAAACLALTGRLGALLHPGDLLCLSGSGAAGAPADFYLTLARLAQSKGASALLDTSGAPLTTAAAATDRPLAVLRMDDAEAEELAGRPLPALADLAALGRRLVSDGACEMAVIAKGAAGSLLVTADGPALVARPPKVPVVSKVGAGDSFVGAFALALSRGEGPAAALALGVAAAAAAVQTPGTRLCDPDETARLLPMVEAGVLV